MCRGGAVELCVRLIECGQEVQVSSHVTYSVCVCVCVQLVPRAAVCPAPSCQDKCCEVC